MPRPPNRGQASTARFPTHLSRRRFGALALAGAASVGLQRAGIARADDRAVSPEPPAVYVRETGHHLQGPILDWWLQYGQHGSLGHPVTEPVWLAGRSMQFFERGAIEVDPHTPDPLLATPLDLGAAWDRRIKTIRSTAPAAEHESDLWFEQTERGVHPELLETYREGGGAFAFGYPVDWADTSGGRLSQIFERAWLAMTPSGPRPIPLGLWEAARLKLPIGPVRSKPGALTYRPGALAPSIGPVRERSVEVDLPTQITTFYAGDTPVYRALTSTGVYPDFTPVGRWQIFVRHDRSRLVSFGNTARSYDFDNVQYVQYFTDDWVGFHATYWHNDFGTRRSAGCVNLRLEDARWAWDFCNHGTPVVVRQ